MRMEPDRRTDDAARDVIGAAIEAYRVLGTGYLEGVYEEALTVELSLCGIPFERQRTVAVDYRGHRVGEGRLDLLVAGRLVLELKAVEALAPIHTAQVMSYIKTMHVPLGLLRNFNVSLLKSGIKRTILSNPFAGLGDLAVQPGVAQ